MTIPGIAAAIAVGLAVGALGRLVVPGRPGVPLWLTMTIGAAAALLGAISAWLVGARELNLLALIVQAGLATVGVVIVLATASKEHSDSR
ncbi:GlsB/YeaQ/YmgE family stress response membrane protein [Verrucosispora sp. ts21]|uniref:GlsB/YeaQ/YmgE family stress response membrane protein n=1 Tax=Verrucosispora sp. ts21 TaxID=2069341 RepID=UPI000C883102|nr:GlsB/YeaQ/YmgE family stress response membrane protein [Verrucosispora sp. ts21]PMR58240.1 GlsB/YeaQ/YmgE family stress response membrane protein [Verrucosispora sp. ts21]